jgi:cobalamin biosynthesis protein CobD/CbiB
MSLINRFINRFINNNASKNTAAILGTLITTIALTVCITLLWPFGNVIEQIFAGGTFFFVFWASLFYWTVLADTGKQAWGRILIILLPVLAIDIFSLLQLSFNLPAK